MRKARLSDETADGIGILIGLAALICILLYNWWHTGGFIANHTEPRFFGYLAAVGIELGVIWLSFRIGRVKTNRNRRLWSTIYPYTLLAAVVISAAANLSEGFLTKYDIKFNIASLLKVDKVEFALTLLATVVMSIIVFALSDVLSNEAKNTVKVKESETVTEKSDLKVMEREPEVVVKPVVIKRSAQKVVRNSTNVQAKSSKLRKNIDGGRLADYVQANPQASYRELIEQVPGLGPVSEVKRQTAALGWHKNGNGWERSG